MLWPLDRQHKLPQEWQTSGDNTGLRDPQNRDIGGLKGYIGTYCHNTQGSVISGNSALVYLVVKRLLLGETLTLDITPQQVIVASHFCS